MDGYVNANRYPALVFAIKVDGHHSLNHSIELHDGSGDDNVAWGAFTIQKTGQWEVIKLGIGKSHKDEWTESIFNPSDFRWDLIRGVRFSIDQKYNESGDVWVDMFHFGRGRWEATKENLSSQASYGLRELVEVDEELHSDNECYLRAKALLAYLKDPVEYLTLRSTVIDYGNTPFLPSDKIHITLPNENVDADYRIISTEYHVIAREQTLEITLELGKESPLLADYLYALRSKTGSLARYKVGR